MPYITKTREMIWGIALLLYFVGDLVTTILGMTNPNIEEVNILISHFFSSNNAVGIIIFKTIPFIIFFTVDMIIVDLYEKYSFIGLIIPIYLSWIGLQATINNITILQKIGINPIIPIIITIVLTYLISSIVQNEFNLYETR